MNDVIRNQYFTENELLVLLSLKNGFKFFGFEIKKELDENKLLKALFNLNKREIILEENDSFYISEEWSKIVDNILFPEFILDLKNYKEEHQSIFYCSENSYIVMEKSRTNQDKLIISFGEMNNLSMNLIDNGLYINSVLSQEYLNENEKSKISAELEELLKEEDQAFNIEDASHAKVVFMDGIENKVSKEIFLITYNLEDLIVVRTQNEIAVYCYSESKIKELLDYMEEL